MMPQQYCLRWKHHHSNVQSMFAQLLEKERFCDVTLYCSPSFATQVSDKDPVDPENIRGVSLRAHRVVLAACSELLGALLCAHEAHGEPVLVLDGAEPRHLRALLDYMYTGEMNVHHSQLASLLKTAEELRIKGLTDIRWNNKDEPPDCHTGAVTTTSSSDKKRTESRPHEPKSTESRRTPTSPGFDTVHVKKEIENDVEPKQGEKFNVNGGPPPLIKLPTKEKNSPLKRERSDTESPSPKRHRMASNTEHSDDEDRDHEWQHGNMDITAERVVGWCAVGSGGAGGGGGEVGGAGGGGGDITGGPGGEGSWSRDASDDEWADAPADIGSFLHTRLQVDGDNSADEESNEEAPPSTASSAGAGSTVDLKIDLPHHKAMHSAAGKPTIGPKSGPSDPRFTDVVKLNDYLRHGRRPQFWEESYVKRVMEAVRLKELEMKQAAEILGVSYGTLYGRYRDVYGCINRPYRTWPIRGPSDLLDQLQRGEVSLDAGAQALGVTPSNLARYLIDATQMKKTGEFEPIPIEIDPSLKMKASSFSYSGGASASNIVKAMRKNVANAEQAQKNVKKVVLSSMTDEDPIPATVITTHDAKKTPSAATASGKWPSIRVASLESLRGAEPEEAPPPASAAPPAAPAPAPPPAPPASPSLLMRTRPDLTIVAAKKPAPRDEPPPRDS